MFIFWLLSVAVFAEESASQVDPELSQPDLEIPDTPLETFENPSNPNDIHQPEESSTNEPFISDEQDSASTQETTEEIPLPETNTTEESPIFDQTPSVIPIIDSNETEEDNETEEYLHSEKFTHSEGFPATEDFHNSEEYDESEEFPNTEEYHNTKEFTFSEEFHSSDEFTSTEEIPVATPAMTVAPTETPTPSPSQSNPPLPIYDFTAEEYCVCSASKKECKKHCYHDAVRVSSNDLQYVIHNAVKKELEIILYGNDPKNPPVISYSDLNDKSIEIKSENEQQSLTFVLTDSSKRAKELDIHNVLLHLQFGESSESTATLLADENQLNVKTLEIKDSKIEGDSSFVLSTENLDSDIKSISNPSISQVQYSKSAQIEDNNISAITLGEASAALTSRQYTVQLVSTATNPSKSSLEIETKSNNIIVSMANNQTSTLPLELDVSEAKNPTVTFDNSWTNSSKCNIDINHGDQPLVINSDDPEFANNVIVEGQGTVTRNGEQDSTKKGLSAGVIAAIVIACVVAVVLIIVGIVCGVKHCSRTKGYSNYHSNVIVEPL